MLPSQEVDVHISLRADRSLVASISIGDCRRAKALPHHGAQFQLPT